MAVDALNDNRAQRLILVRPAVEAGEKLGFLPGDLTQKVDPYLRPLYDALYEMLGIERVTKLVERNVIEIAPLAYMRGRTLNDSFVILDEAQNTTIEQMKMFLTRIGFGSIAVVTGDVTQTDLPRTSEIGPARCHPMCCATSMASASPSSIPRTSSAIRSCSASCAPTRRARTNWKRRRRKDEMSGTLRALIDLPARRCAGFDRCVAAQIAERAGKHRVPRPTEPHADQQHGQRYNRRPGRERNAERVHLRPDFALRHRAAGRHLVRGRFGPASRATTSTPRRRSWICR